MENTDKEKLLEAANNITNPIKQKEEIFMLMDTLGLSYRRTNCGRCLKDYLNIAKEELGAIADASEESGWNGEWVYLCKHAQTWNGHIIDQNTDPKVIEEFVKRFPKGYFEKRSVK